MKNRRGSFTVFLLMVFSALLILLWAVITSSARETVSATVNHFGRLWGTSILAEYDRNLKDRYGLYGFYGEPSLTGEKLELYARYSFQGKAYVDFQDVSCSLDGYSLAETDVIKKQMEQAVLLGNRPKPVSAEISHDLQENTQVNRKITSRWILDYLPSAGASGEPDAQSAANAAKSGYGFRDLAGSAAVNQYIFTYFRHYCGPDELDDTYFRNEIEYVLCGKPDDEKARKKARQKLVLLRNVLNLAYLYSCPEKRDAAMALASVLTPGPEAALTQGLLLELWAYAEAENDLALLYDNLKVPLVKTDRTWALTLENAVGDGTGLDDAVSSERKHYIRPASVEGLLYEEYLRILLNTVQEDTRILRAMDLIQINMKYQYVDSFRLSDYYTGLRFSLKVNGVIHEFEENYERKNHNTEADS